MVQEKMCKSGKNLIFQETKSYISGEKVIISQEKPDMNSIRDMLDSLIMERDVR